MRRYWLVLWRMGLAYLFYPAMIGLFLWLYFNQAHWGLGLMVITAIFILDPIWYRLAQNAIHMWKNRKN